MVIPLIAIVGGTIIASAIPFLFPTKAETATVELNKKLDASGQFVLAPIKSGADSRLNNFEIDNLKIFLILVAVVIFFIVVVR